MYIWLQLENQNTKLSQGLREKEEQLSGEYA